MLSEEVIDDMKRRYMGPDPERGAKDVWALLREREELLGQIAIYKKTMQWASTCDSVKVVVDADNVEPLGDNYPTIHCRDGA